MPPRDVLGNGTGFLLRERAHDRNQQLAFGVECPDVLLFEVHLHSGVLQLAHGGERVDGIAGEPRDGLGDDEVDLARECVGDHGLESDAAFGGGAGDAFVGVDPGELPASVFGDVAGVVIDLRRIGGDLVFVVGGHASVACDAFDRWCVQAGSAVELAGCWDRGDRSYHVLFSYLGCALGAFHRSCG
ncbi:Uncharacterised protein [Chlamydia trachomatis]|nr:Uncharacterised protein [Chlamydia trachomatis]